MKFVPRPAQERILEFTSGRMGVIAVPGSGKTHTLSALAARLIQSGVLAEDQEVLVVTLVNSAVNNFASRIAGFLNEMGLLRGLGYRIRTLHGLAHDIVRERPDLAGVANDFQIVDERISQGIIRTALRAWMSANPQEIDALFAPEVSPDKRKWLAGEQLPDLLEKLGTAFIRQAKDYRLKPSALREKVEGLKGGFPLLRLGVDLYSDYQRALTFRGAVDFDDLMSLAMDVLRADPDYLDLLRHRWPYILEDEAQDSSELQEKMLRLLSEPNGNWVRVGDPNQAIYETFTTANPRFLREFVREEGVSERDLPNSGRSSLSIITLANHLIDWVNSDEAPEGLRASLSEPHIQPVAADDPQPNPPDKPDEIFLYNLKQTPDDEVNKIAISLKRWLVENPEKTAACLVPTNHHGAKLVDALKAKDVPFLELLQSTDSTRQAAELVASALQWLAEPSLPRTLTTLYKHWVARQPGTEGDPELLIRKTAAALLGKCARTEDYLAPHGDADWLSDQAAALDPLVMTELERFRSLLQVWLKAVLLPVDQLVLTISQDVFREPADLALGYKLASLLDNAQNEHPAWGLKELADELTAIAGNQRKFIGFSDDDLGFDPDQHRGKAVVTTIHKAKGLEWDRVYLLSLNNYDFPAGSPHDSYRSERDWIRGGLNLQAELLAQLKALAGDDPVGLYLPEGEATLADRLNYISERARVLYVGITRARSQLVVTWNTGRRGDMRPAVLFSMLANFLEEGRDAASG
jgi:DNA helicase-2/ATP-dependent DNA helicase PcrA